MMSTRKRLLLISGIVATAIVFTLILLPYGIEYGIVRALTDQGAEEASVRNVDFNPFTGRLIIQDLTIRDDSETPLDISQLTVQISWRSLFRKRIYLEELTLEGTTVSIEETAKKTWKVGGLEPAGNDEEKVQEPKAEAEPKAPWGFGLEQLAIRSSSIKFRGMGLDTEIDIRDLNISDLKSWEPGLAAAIALSGDLNKSGLVIKTEAHPFSKTPSVKGSFSLDSLSLTPLNSLLPEDAGFSIESGNISSSGSFEFVTGQAEDKINFSGEVSAGDLSIGGSSGIRLFALQSLDLRKIELKSLEEISVSEIDLKNIELITPSGKDARDTGDQSPVLTTERLLVSGIATNGLDDISIGSVNLEGSRALLLRRPDGGWHLIDDVTESMAADKEDVNGQETSETEAEEAGSVKVRIADIMIEGNSIRFEDESIEPPYRTELLLDKVELHNIDSSVPENNSTWAVEGRMGDYSSMSFSGDIQPLAERLTVNINGKIEQLDLHPLSSYTIKATGYNVQSGHLNSDIDIKITSGIIKSENALVLKKLAISPKDETRIDELASGLGLSIESALSLLRDSDGTIRFTLPVEGDINEPDIQLGDIIGKAVTEAMKKTAFSYLKHTIQPYGALITIIQLAGEAAKIQLDPVAFDAGAAMLNTEAGEYMKTVANLLNERPELEVSICGKTASQDTAVLTEKAIQAMQAAAEEALAAGEQEAAPAEESEASPPEQEALTVEIPDEELLQLARERADNVKKVLAEEYGIDPGRLFICNPEISRDEEAKPAVELLI